MTFGMVMHTMVKGIYHVNEAVVFRDWSKSIRGGGGGGGPEHLEMWLIKNT